VFRHTLIICAWAPFAVGLIGAPLVHAAAPIWAKGAVTLSVGCEDSKDVETLRSPDKTTTVDVQCAGSHPARTGVMLRVSTRGRLPLDVAIALDSGSVWRPQEVLWAPDSSAFVINGSESAYGGAQFVVYEIRSAQPTTRRITNAAQKDMAQTFPPCRAANFDVVDCNEFASDPQFNMSAIAWTRGSRALVVFAEVPCSSTFGGIMCQVMGYEIEVASGRILARMTAVEFKRRYQSQAAWTIKVPGKPIFKR
jgi:hypothetical protein